MIPDNAQQFLVTLEFADPVDAFDAPLIAKNVETAIQDWADHSEAGIAPEHTFTTKIAAEPMSVQVAKDVLKASGYLMIFWTENDIRDYELGEGGYDDEGNEIPPLTDEEVGDIMYSLESNFDASLGINWDTIGSAVWDALEYRKNED